MIKRKWTALTISILLILSLTAGAAMAEEINTVEDFEVEYLAAPAVAGLLLEEAGVDNRYGTGRNGGNYISDVAQHMGPETYFDGVDKYDEYLYEYQIAAYINGLLEQNGDSRRVIPRLGTFDPEASYATATDNADGTVTLEITVLDRCGYGISGLNPLSDFYVEDSVIAGQFYFGTSSIPGSGVTEWQEQEGVYSVTLDRNLFSARPAGYDNGWYQIWDIFVEGEIIEEGLVLHTTYYAVGDWDLDLYIGTTLYDRFIIISEQSDGDIQGFFGIGSDVNGKPTGVITGTIDGRSISMFYDRTGYSSDGYTAKFSGTIAVNGNSMSGTWTDRDRGGVSQTWTMVRQ